MYLINFGKVTSWPQWMDRELASSRISETTNAQVICFWYIVFGENSLSTYPERTLEYGSRTNINLSEFWITECSFKNPRSFQFFNLIRLVFVLEAVLSLITLLNSFLINVDPTFWIWQYNKLWFWSKCRFCPTVSSVEYPKNPSVLFKHASLRWRTRWEYTSFNNTAFLK